MRKGRGGRGFRSKKFNKRKALGYRKKVAGIMHSIKRLAKPVFVQNSVIGPTLSADGGGSFSIGGPIAGLLPGTNEVGMSAQFQLNSVIDVADLTSLFDRYKIVGVALKIHYLQSSPSFANGFTGNLPTLHYAFDGDDVNVPPNANSVLVKGYCKSVVLNANRPTKIYIRPRLTKEVYAPLMTGYTSEKACWLDCNSDTVPHYGLKMWLSDWLGATDNNNALRIQPTYYLKLRDTQ